MEAMHSSTSGASEDNHISDPNLCLHHHLQHHSRPASNIFSTTREFHGHPHHKRLQNPSSFASVHPLPHAYSFRPPLRNRLRADRPKIHCKRIRNLPPSENRHWPLHRHLLNGFGSIGGEQEKRLGFASEQEALDLLDRSSVLNLWPFRDVHCCGSCGVLLQAISGRHAGIFDCHDLLFILLWILLEFTPCFSSE